MARAGSHRSGHKAAWLLLAGSCTASQAGAGNALAASTLVSGQHPAPGPWSATRSQAATQRLSAAEGALRRQKARSMRRTRPPLTRLSGEARKPASRLRGRYQRWRQRSGSQWRRAGYASMAPSSVATDHCASAAEHTWRSRREWAWVLSPPQVRAVPFRLGFSDSHPNPNPNPMKIAQWTCSTFHAGDLWQASAIAS